MSVKRFFGATSRDALKEVRESLGSDAIILSNRRVAGGVEVLASHQEHLSSMISESITAPSTPTHGLRKPASDEHQPRPSGMAAASGNRTSASKVPGKRPFPETRIFKPGTAPIKETFQRFVERSANEKDRTYANDEINAIKRPQPIRDDSFEHHFKANQTSGTVLETGNAPALMAEIMSMKALLQGQMEALSWRDTMRTRPLQARQMSQLMAAGFSPALSRAITNRLPADYSETQANQWLQSNLARNLICATEGRDLVDRGGVIALVGPTGVGKTTTTAKLAARCVVKYGVKKLGLITVDSYRVGAEDQLRTYGKILGVTVHTARDAQSLADLIALMRDKHLVLIDTVGMGQRDTRVLEQTEMLNSPSIERVLVLNAAAQGETLDDVVRAYRGEGHGRIQRAILSKLDEAVKIGAGLDCLIRHKLELQFVTNGQRVPEDLHMGNSAALLDKALKHRAEPVYALNDVEMPLLMTGLLPEGSADALQGFSHA